MLKLLSKSTKELSASNINEICHLKDSQWKFGLKSQLDWFKNNIYDPGGTRIHPDQPEKTKMRIFGVQLSWPKLSFPTWAEIRAALPWWLGGGGAEGGVTKLFTKHFQEWKWDFPHDIDPEMPCFNKIFYLDELVKSYYHHPEYYDTQEKAPAVTEAAGGISPYRKCRFDLRSKKATEKEMEPYELSFDPEKE